VHLLPFQNLLHWRNRITLCVECLYPPTNEKLSPLYVTFHVNSVGVYVCKFSRNTALKVRNGIRGILCDHFVARKENLLIGFRMPLLHGSAGCSWRSVCVYI
jgi:hypothetical protein